MCWRAECAWYWEPTSCVISKPKSSPTTTCQLQPNLLSRSFWTILITLHQLLLRWTNLDPMSNLNTVPVKFLQSCNQDIDNFLLITLTDWGFYPERPSERTVHWVGIGDVLICSERVIFPLLTLVSSCNFIIEKIVVDQRQLSAHVYCEENEYLQWGKWIPFIPLSDSVSLGVSFLQHPAR